MITWRGALWVAMFVGFAMVWTSLGSLLGWYIGDDLGVYVWGWVSWLAMSGWFAFELWRARPWRGES